MSTPIIRQTVEADPSATQPCSVSGWFIDPRVEGQKYQLHSGSNIITPYVCGSEYLPALQSALKNAKKSIYISIWGFDPILNLAHTGRTHGPTDDTIGEVLRTSAAAGVEVKLLLFYTRTVDIGTNNAPGISATPLPTDGLSGVNDTDLLNYGNDPYRRQWFARANAGVFSGLQFLRRGGTSGQITARNYAETQARRQALPNSYPISTVPQLTLTDHQKMILIDHEDPTNAFGFVQGFNLMPDYFDEIDHPYISNKRQGQDLIQDIGVGIKGTALIDLYHNFKQSWDENLSGNASALTTPAPDVQALRSSVGSQPYHTQILRTWPATEEYNIERFYENALSLCCDHVYVEDQYFRSPELVEWFLARAKQLRELGSDKKIYMFVVTNTISSGGLGEGSLRQAIMTNFGREDVVSIESDDHEEWAEHIGDEEKIKAIEQRLDAMDAKVSVAILKTPSHGNYHVRYKDIYVHSKLATFNDTCYTLGSANWNIRSMRADTELNIAVKNIRQTQDLRKKLWGLHFNNQLPNTNNMQRQYMEWQEKLMKNDIKIDAEEAPYQRAFSYHEKLNAWVNMG